VLGQRWRLEVASDLGQPGVRLAQLGDPRAAALLCPGDQRAQPG
jgi:hypothetical protein